MAIGTLTAFWAVSFLLVLVPGADWAYAIAAGLRDRSVLPAVAGLLAGYAVLTAVVAAGVAEGELGVIEAEAVQNGRVEIVHVALVLSDP